MPAAAPHSARMARRARPGKSRRGGGGLAGALAVGGVIGAVLLAIAGGAVWYLGGHGSGGVRLASRDSLIVLPADHGRYSVFERNIETGSERLLGTYGPDELHAMGLDPIGYQFSDRSIGARLMAFKFDSGDTGK